jgi:hypothetical protein
MNPCWPAYPPFPRGNRWVAGSSRCCLSPPPDCCREAGDYRTVARYLEARLALKQE